MQQITLVSIVMSEISEKTEQITPLARYLFENGLTVRMAAELFATNRTSLAQMVKAERSPEGLTRELITLALLGEISLSELKRLAASRGSLRRGERRVSLVEFRSMADGARS